MEQLKNLLQQEFMRRSSKNSAYSLRAYAKQLNIDHSTLSALLSGKRKITKKAAQKLAMPLGLGPKELQELIGTKSMEADSVSTPYYLIQSDAFAAMSEWYYDAILELSRIKNIRLTPKLIAQSIGISALQAGLALKTLERLELLEKNTKTGRYILKHSDSTNSLDLNFTTAAQKKYQRAILEKSMEALEGLDRTVRDHTSTTIALDQRDLSKAKILIQNFRQQLNTFLQRKDTSPNEVYQLQVGFFPISNLSNIRSKHETH
jgi:uncharacterized protein (TIGR02147 family)